MFRSNTLMITTSIVALTSGLSAAPAAAMTEPTTSIRLAEAGFDKAPSPGSVRLDLSGDAFNQLWQLDQVILHQLPLADGQTVDVQLEAFEVIGTDTRFVAVSDDGEEQFEATPMRHYRGHVIGFQDSLAYVWLSEDQIGGLIQLPGIMGLDEAAGGGKTYQFGPEVIGRAASAHYISEAGGRDGRAMCDDMESLVGHVTDQIERSPADANITNTTLMLATIAVDATKQFHDHFGSTGAATTYLQSLFGAISVIYERDLFCKIVLGNVRIFTVTGVYAGTTTTALLDQLRTEWTTNPAVMNLPRTLTHLVTIQGLGGLAYLDVLCSTTFGYGVSSVDGTYTYPNAAYTWDVEVIAHELGHNFSSPHTHCYSPAIDQCCGVANPEPFPGYSQSCPEPGCYQGAAVGTVGSVMSYCHLIATINIAFHATVKAQIRPRIEAAACVPPATSTWLYWRYLANGWNTLWKMNGTSQTAYAISAADTSWTFGGVGDFNADGNKDIVWRQQSTGNNLFWFMAYGATPDVTSGQMFMPVTDTQYSIATVGDLNNDGKPDILWRNEAASATAVWYMNGTAFMSAASLTNVPAEWKLVGAGDLDKDGKTDLIWRHPASGLNAVWYMNNAIITNGVYLAPVPAEYDLGAIVDMNGDGNLDFVWRNTAGQNIVWYMGGATGTTISSSAYLASVTDTSWSLVGPP